MCGIAGFLDLAGARGSAELAARARAMGGTLIHRGPDEGDVWVDSEVGLGFAQRRLAIVDLSSAGRQPMMSSCGRFVLIYNGELYNAEELRADLLAAGRPFRGHSDTEVIAEACAVWGLEQTARRMRGMFALALWDRRERVLSLARDRLGIKPLFWGRFGGLVIFGSELKALLAHGGWPREIDRDALTAYLRFGYVPAPRSIWSGISKLLPGRILAIDAKGRASETTYWSAETMVGEGIAARRMAALSDEAAADELESVLRDAVGRHMVADVPLGAFLSGGYDSSLVVAMMQAQSARPVKTFSIGFHEDGYNEAEHAKAVARHLGTEHTEFYVEPDHALRVIPRLPVMYDEPFGDSSQIPTFLLSEMTRQHVTVALSGDGGDELFAGYSRYTRALAIWRRIGVLPPPVRRAAAAALLAVPVRQWDGVMRLAPSELRHPRAGEMLHKLAAVLREGSDGLYGRLISQWHEPSRVVLGGCEPESSLQDRMIQSNIPDFLDRMQYLDLVTYLPDDILTKVDRASMAVSLEARVPLLDHCLVEYAWRLPQAMKLRGGVTKWLLRQVLYRHVPRHLMERPKMGFGVPIESWLRGPLRDWAEALLSDSRLRSEAYFDPDVVRATWRDHLSGRRDNHYALWTILMFQAWHEHQLAANAALVGA